MDFNKILSFTKLTVYLACTWPPSSSATRWQFIRYNIRRCVLFINILCISLGLVFSIYKYSDDFRIVTQSACFVGCTADVTIKMIAFGIKLTPTQSQIEKMEDFLKIARPHERTVLRRTFARFSIAHVFVCILTYLAAFMTLFAPLVIHHQDLPTMAVYPFPVDSGVVRILVFIQQGIASFQCASSVATNCQAAVMMWFAGARLEILGVETKSIREVGGISDFVEKHNNRLAYAVEVSKSMSYVAFASLMASGLAAIMSSLVLLSNQSLDQKMQFVPIMMVYTANLFVCAWPSDDLINMCHELGNAVYNISWYEMPLSTRKNLLMIIQRCQRPIIVSIGGLLPTLSLRAYAAFLSAVFSYAMTLRAATSDRAR